MASTNVEYYEKQKELQDQMNKSEQERLRLDQQLKAYFQSDQRLGKLKAVRLHNYWKKICEDERRSKQRNEQIRKEFERIDTHTASLASRTEKLRLLKKQYEEYIERTYPQWKEICQAKMANQSPQVAEPTAQNVPQDAPDPIAQTVERQMKQIINTKPASSVANIRAVPPDSTRVQQSMPPSSHEAYRHPPADANRAEQSMPTHEAYSQPVHETYKQAQTYSASSVPASQPVASSVQPGASQVTPHTYVNYQEAQQSAGNFTSKTSGQPLDMADGRRAVSPTARDVELTGRSTVTETPRDVSRVSNTNTQSDTQADRSEEAGPLPVQNVSIQKKTLSSTQPASQAPTSVPGMQPADDDDVSEFGSDVDLPMSDVQAPPIERQRTFSGGDNSREDSISTSKPFTRGSSFHSSKRWSEYGCVKPELTLEGFLFLLKVVQEDFPEAFATDGYYRSYRPDSAARLEIINKANSKSDLKSFDPNQVSMVVLEQLLLVVRSLKEGCLLSDTTLDENPASLTQHRVKERLSLDGQTLWEGLFNHFSLLLHHKVMMANEMAAIFVPCIVEDGSEKQEKAYQLIMKLLASMSGDETDDASSQASPVRQPDRIQEGTGNSETYDGKVPPLKFGSLLEKPLTDDESTSMFSSAPREKMPLNETDAYKNMLTGTMKSQPPRAQDDEDTDDDVEKEFASVLSPRTPRTPASNSDPPPPVANFDTQSKPPQIEDEEPSEFSSPAASPVYVPSAMQPRSTLNSTGSNQAAKRIAGVKIGSDFDSDSELDVLKASQKRQQVEDMDDLEFYA